MNPTIDLLLRHHSIRKYKPDPIPQEYIETIIRCAQMAATSSHMQAYSIIGVTDAAIKQELSSLSGNQAYITECPLFLVWCADLFRLGMTCEMYDVQIVHDTVESFVIATVDTAIAAQNAATAAESLGLGIVYIGGIRNRIDEVTRLLGLPKFVYPVFGMCVGYSAQAPTLRPRLPFETVYHKNRYDTDKLNKLIKTYDDIYHAYMLERSNGKNGAKWSEQMAARLGHPERKHMREYLVQQGFMFK
jgi:FMN reductase (NADPH)